MIFARMRTVFQVLLMVLGMVALLRFGQIRPKEYLLRSNPVRLMYQKNKGTNRIMPSFR